VESTVTALYGYGSVINIPPTTRTRTMTMAMMICSVLLMLRRRAMLFVLSVCRELCKSSGSYFSRNSSAACK